LSDSQAFKFLQASALRDQAALYSRFGGADQIAAMDLLRYSHVI